MCPYSGESGEHPSDPCLNRYKTGLTSNIKSQTFKHKVMCILYVLHRIITRTESGARSFLLFPNLFIKTTNCPLQ